MILDYVKLKPNKAKKTNNKRIYLRILLVAVLGAFVVKYFHKLPHVELQQQINNLASAKEQAPKLRFYDVLVNEATIAAESKPFVLAAGEYTQLSACAELAVKLKKYQLAVHTQTFSEHGLNKCEVLLGPFANLNAAYRVKAEMYDKGYVLALRDNYLGAKQ